MPKNTSADVGFDDTGRVIAIGEEARAQQDRIIDHPDATPILVVAALHGDIGVRVYGSPTEDTLQLLEHITKTYRQALALHTQQSDPKKTS